MSTPHNPCAVGKSSRRAAGNFSVSVRQLLELKASKKGGNSSYRALSKRGTIFCQFTRNQTRSQKIHPPGARDRVVVEGLSLEPVRIRT